MFEKVSLYLQKDILFVTEGHSTNVLNLVVVAIRDYFKVFYEKLIKVRNKKVGLSNLVDLEEKDQDLIIEGEDEDEHFVKGNSKQKVELI